MKRLDDTIREHAPMYAMFTDERSCMATKDKNSKKSMEKKRAQKTLKEKRQAKRDKK